jgi:hypothetical protein
MVIIGEALASAGEITDWGPGVSSLAPWPLIRSASNPRDLRDRSIEWSDLPQLVGVGAPAEKFGARKVACCQDMCIMRRFSILGVADRACTLVAC